MTRTNQSGILDIASQIYTAQAGWSVRGTSNKYTPRDTEFVVIVGNGKACATNDGPIKFATRHEAHEFARKYGHRPHTVKPINSLAAQAATGATP